MQTYKFGNAENHCHIFTSLLLLFFTVVYPYSLSNAQELTLYTWENYIAEQVVKDFQKHSGIAVKLEYFDSDQVRDETIASISTNRFDLVIFDSISAQIFGKNNKILGISKSEIPNMKNIDKRWQESCGNFGLPYFYGTVGIVYDATKFKKTPTSWKQLLSPETEHQGHVVMVEDMTDSLIPPLLSLGYNVNTEKESELKEAYTLLQKQVPWVLNYKYALTNLQHPGNGKRMHMALGYSGDQYSLNDASGSENWQYIIPEEGTVIWVDCLSIPANSTHKKEALQFLNYLADPEVVAVNTEEIYAAPPVSAARQFMSSEAAKDETLFPPEDFFQKAQMYRILSDKNIRQRRRIFDAIQRQHETQ
ncbi:polyamine ABC transporter substrate-binding protein [Desulfogranum japonicum]|uniref:polyamine ABC transporter substrate-binding protein n=1 Tax=Desulfogranum japonicum TaxID=231447 RepID=UPI0003FFA928|nr:spermidine/putrescine ABC transporter substrate-binding protein [Desulfogranum japonicum]